MLKLIRKEKRGIGESRHLQSHKAGPCPLAVTYFMADGDVIAPLKCPCTMGLNGKGFLSVRKTEFH